MKLAIALSASLLLVPTMSVADPAAGLLPAGKPAGIHHAQDATDNTALYVVGGVVLLGVIIGVAASSGGNSSASNTAPPVVTPH